jgi:hypothetical protein
MVLFGVISFSTSASARDPESYQIILYEHNDYKGSYIVLEYDRDVNNISFWHTDSDKSWNDKVSSLKVGKDAKVILYKDKDYKGESITIQGDCNNDKNKTKLTDIGWNDKVTSLKVRKADCNN